MLLQTVALSHAQILYMYMYFNRPGPSTCITLPTKRCSQLDGKPPPSRTASKTKAVQDPYPMHWFHGWWQAQFFHVTHVHIYLLSPWPLVVTGYNINNNKTGKRKNEQGKQKNESRENFLLNFISNRDGPVKSLETTQEDYLHYETMAEKKGKKTAFLRVHHCMQA